MPTPVETATVIPKRMAPLLRCEPVFISGDGKTNSDFT